MPSAKTKQPPRGGDDLTQLTLRVPRRWIPIFDAIAKKEAATGAVFSRTDAVRKVMALGIDVAQKHPRT